MSKRHCALAIIAALAAPLACVGPTVAHAVEQAMELKWHQLIPPAPRAPLKSFLHGSPVDIGKLGGPDDGTPAPPPQPEGRWMSAPTKSSEAPVPIVSDLDGKRVRIGGYVVSLDFDATRVKEFLLVPFVGACIHVPPPPANQIIYVKSAKGFEVQGTFDPVWVTGTMKVSQTFTGLAETGYSIDADEVAARPPG